MQVKHNAEELNEGETVILTLADRNILDDKGDLDDEADELENALVVRLFLCRTHACMHGKVRLCTASRLFGIAQGCHTLAATVSCVWRIEPCHLSSMATTILPFANSVARS